MTLERATALPWRNLPNWLCMWATWLAVRSIPRHAVAPSHLCSGISCARSVAKTLKRAHVIDYSSGEEAHDGVYKDLMVAFQLLQPFLTKLGFSSQQELEQLYQQVLTEMASHDFCALWYL